MSEKNGFFGFGKSRELMHANITKEKEYPQVIYTFEGASELYKDLVYATYAAMISIGFDIALVDHSLGKKPYRLAVRSKSVDKPVRSEAAIFLGALEATKLIIQAQVDNLEKLNSTALTQDQQVVAESIALSLISDLQSEEELYQAFQQYYGGLRWGSDQERLKNVLFVYGTDLDFDLLDNYIQIGNLESVAYRLDLDIDYKERKPWYEKGVVAVLEQYPALDYRQLKDEKFCQTEEGKTLAAIYTQICGEILANQVRNSETIITTAGIQQPKPAIPLSRHPIFEALMIDEVSLDRPKAKYDFGPSDLTELIIASDSRAAHQAIVKSITTRLPEEHRRVFDGPSEFQHKRGLVRNILREYNNALPGSIVGELVKEDMIAILNAYVGEGDLLNDAREEYAVRMQQGYSYGGDITDIPLIVGDIVEVSIASPDFELVSYAQQLIEFYLMQQHDPFSLKKSEMIELFLDSLSYISSGSYPEIFSQISTLLFDDERITSDVQRCVELKIHSRKLYSKPKAQKALRHLRTFSIHDDKNTERHNAEAAYAKEVVTASELSEKHHALKSDIALTLLMNLVQENNQSSVAEVDKLFNIYLKKISIGTYDMDSLTDMYFKLVDVALSDDVSVRQRKAILSHISSSFKYVQTDSQHLLVQVVLDMYQIALGPVDAISLPNKDSKYIFNDVKHLVTNNGRGIFKSATQEELAVLEEYATVIREHVDNIATNNYLGELSAEDETLTAWREEQVEILAELVRDMKSIQKVYAEYLRIEAVKVQPHMYYAWMIEQLIPFWQGMQWEVGEGNRPGRDIRALFETLQRFVRHVLETQKLLKVQENNYPEEFDCITQGQLDSFLKELYVQIVVPYDIGHNTTVWQKGLPFFSMAISHMPETLLQEIISKHEGSDFAEHLKTKLNRRNSNDE